MSEDQAKLIAAVFRGDAWQSGGDIWLVIIRRQDGHLVVLSDEIVCEYESEADFDKAKVKASIHLC